MSKQPIMRDVARHTGLSISSVSLALRDSPKISVATRQAVRKAARDLGYRPNPMLAALSAHRWRQRPHSLGTTLALLADGTLEGQSGMVERAAACGYQTEIFQIRDYPDPRRLVNILSSRGILGLVVGQVFTPGFCESFDWSRFVAVACCEGGVRPPVNMVMPNHFLAMQDGWDHACALGYRRIGMAMYKDVVALDCRDRLAAFLERQRNVRVADQIPALIIETNLHDASKKSLPQIEQKDLTNVMNNWLSRHRPDVVMGFNNAFRWPIKDAGWNIPRQVAFISLWETSQDKQITGLALTHDEVGARAIDWLDSLLRAGERGIPKHPATMLVDMVWQKGKTAPKVVR